MFYAKTNSFEEAVQIFLFRGAACCLVVVNSSPDEQGRKECENVGLKEGDEEFEDAEQRGTQNADNGDGCPHFGRGSSGCCD